jgi:hypothetical protein
MSHRHIDPMDRNDTYGMPSRPCVQCRVECCVDCAEPRPTTEDPRALKCWGCVEDERATADELLARRRTDRDQRDLALDAIAAHVREYILAPDSAKLAAQVALDRIERVLLDVRGTDFGTALSTFAQREIDTKERGDG